MGDGQLQFNTPIKNVDTKFVNGILHALHDARTLIYKHFNTKMVNVR